MVLLPMKWTCIPRLYFGKYGPSTQTPRGANTPQSTSPMVPSMESMYVGKYNILHRADETNSVWSLPKFVCAKITFTLFSSATSTEYFEYRQSEKPTLSTKEQFDGTTNKNNLLKAYNRMIIIPLGICKYRIEHNNKQKMCKFFVVLENEKALLGMPDINTLNIIHKLQETI